MTTRMRQVRSDAKTKGDKQMKMRAKLLLWLGQLAEAGKRAGRDGPRGFGTPGFMHKIPVVT